MDPARTDRRFRIERTFCSESATQEFAAAISTVVGPRDVIALRGDLGAGKTVFARALIRARMRQDVEVPSPTFTLVQIYEPSSLPDPAIWHFDLFRLHAPEDTFELGIEDAFAAGISLIEWPERLGPLLPANRLDLTLMHADAPERRRALIEGGTDWLDRLLEAGLA